MPPTCHAANSPACPDRRAGEFGEGEEKGDAPKGKESSLRGASQWFESLHAKPASANRSLPVLSVKRLGFEQSAVTGFRQLAARQDRQAKCHPMVRGIQRDSTRRRELGAACVPADHEPCGFPGHIETNPARGLKRNPRPKLTRFLSREEIGRLHEVLDGYEPRRPSCKAQVDIIRLLLLTGCRTGEMLKLRWREVGVDTLELEDSKTGPRQVLLSPEARAIIERQPRSGSPWVFPSPMNPGRPRFDISIWKRVRKLAGIHPHLLLARPQHLPFEEFKALIISTWKRTEWADHQAEDGKQLLIQPITDGHYRTVKYNVKSSPDSLDLESVSKVMRLGPICGRGA